MHDPGYVAAVRTVSGWADELGARGLEAAQQRYARAFGLGTGDQPVFAGMHQASALVAGATLAAARAVWSGPAGHGASIAGGMHHAMAARASGFGVYNDVAAAIAWLLGHGAERVAYVDIDAHHGDGVQAALSVRSAGADDQRAPAPGGHVPVHRAARRDRRARRGGVCGQCALPAWTVMPAGCAPSTRSSRLCWPSSGRRFWSASTGPTPTGWIRWPAWS